MPDFAGRWLTSFGLMDLAQEGGRVVGTYGPDQECRLAGDVEGDLLRFRYEEPREAGEGWFALPRVGKFAGRYRPDGDTSEGAWVGHRAFDGIFESTFGRLRLVQEAGRVVGYYEGPGP